MQGVSFHNFLRDGVLYGILFKHRLHALKLSERSQHE